MSRFSLAALNRKLVGYYSKFQLTLLVPVVEAQKYGSPPSNIDSGTQLICAINTVAGFLFQVFIALSVIFIIVAALFYLTAAGNQTQLDRAKNVLIYSIVAIVIALLAGGITLFIGDVTDVDTATGTVDIICQ